MAIVEVPSTVWDHCRETLPFVLVLGGTSAGSPATAFIHAPVGTPNPVLARARSSPGSGREGAFASAVLPLPSTRLGVQHASDLSVAASTSGTRISRLCAIPAQSASRNN